MNAQRLVDHLHAIRYHNPVSARRLRLGDPTLLLPILHFALLTYSPHVAAHVAARGFMLYAKDDASFTDAVFRLAAQHLGVHSGLQARQFLSRGFVGACCANKKKFSLPPEPSRALTKTPHRNLPSLRARAERKLQFTVGIIRACQSLHEDACRAAAAAGAPPVAPYTAHYSLAPASASTRWHTRATARVERTAPQNALLPARADSLPGAGVRASSDRIYSVGVGANVASSEEAVAAQVRGGGGRHAACCLARIFFSATAHFNRPPPPHTHTPPLCAVFI